MSRWWLGFAGLNGAMAVALGAYAAHGLSGDAYLQSLAERASSYQLLHAVALVAIMALPERFGRWRLASASLIGLGMVLFCGTLTFRSLTGQALPVPILTPMGGVCFILGWLLWVVAVIRR